jgi:hypothetical protein
VDFRFQDGKLPNRQNSKSIHRKKSQPQRSNAELQEKRMNQSLKDYLKKVRKVQWFICVVPLGGWVLKGHWKNLFPIVGDEDANLLCLTLTGVLASVGAILPLAFTATKARLSILLTSLLLLIFSAAAYWTLAERYIVSIPTPNGKLTVSVGSVRSPFANDVAKEACPQYGCTDAELLMAEGPYEDRVHKLWTEDSITGVRLKTAGSYAAIIFLLNFIIGVFAKQEQDCPSAPR